MQPQPCVFGDVVPWPDVPVPTAAMPTVPRVLTDWSVPAFDRGALEQVASILASACDAVLVGDHQDRPDFPPTQLATMLLEVGVTPWLTLTCRDRNRLVLEQDLRGLHHLGIRTVLCVTGDGRAYDVRPDVSQVFDLDSTRLAALAASVGMAPGVVEAPTASPRQLRPARLVEKQRAGATVGVLNHVAAVSEVADFVYAARRHGLVIPVIASVAVFTDAVSAAVLQALPGLDLDPDAVTAVTGARDPVIAGIDSAVAEAMALLAIDGIDGVNLSGLASSRGYAAAAEIQAEIGRRILSAFPTPSVPDTQRSHPPTVPMPGDPRPDVAPFEDPVSEDPVSEAPVSDDPVSDAGARGDTGPGTGTP
jgi:methylenetetrahydrofolate reductase (NADPH)